MLIADSICCHSSVPALNKQTFNFFNYELDPIFASASVRKSSPKLDFICFFTLFIHSLFYLSGILLFLSLFMLFSDNKRDKCSV